MICINSSSYKNKSILISYFIITFFTGVELYSAQRRATYPFRGCERDTVIYQKEISSLQLEQFETEKKMKLLVE